MAQKFYVIQVISGFEEYVKKLLEAHIKLEPQLKKSFGRILVPGEKVIEMKGGKERKTDRKFYPGYILIEMEASDFTCAIVSRINKVISFVGGRSGKPMPISNKEIEKILLSIQQGVDKPQPKVLFEPGEMIKVIDGPFADFKGVLVEMDYKNSSLKVEVPILGRVTPIKLNITQVEKA